jgi:hypothetical protein
MAKLRKEQVISIAQNHMDAVGTFMKSQPRSALIGYAGDAFSKLLDGRSSRRIAAS